MFHYIILYHFMFQLAYYDTLLTPIWQIGKLAEINSISMKIQWH